MSHRRLTYQPGAMRHDLAQGDRFVEWIFRMKAGQIGVHRRIDIQLALLLQLHHPNGGEQLGEGGDAVDRASPGGGLALGIGQAKSMRPDQGIPGHQGD